MLSKATMAAVALGVAEEAALSFGLMFVLWSFATIATGSPAVQARKLLMLGRKRCLVIRIDDRADCVTANSGLAGADRNV